MEVQDIKIEIPHDLKIEPEEFENDEPTVQISNVKSISKANELQLESTSNGSENTPSNLLAQANPSSAPTTVPTTYPTTALTTYPTTALTTSNLKQYSMYSVPSGLLLIEGGGTNLAVQQSGQLSNTNIMQPINAKLVQGNQVNSHILLNELCTPAALPSPTKFKSVEFTPLAKIQDSHNQTKTLVNLPPNTVEDGSHHLLETSVKSKGTNAGLNSNSQFLPSEPTAIPTQNNTAKKSTQCQTSEVSHSVQLQPTKEKMKNSKTPCNKYGKCYGKAVKSSTLQSEGDKRVNTNAKGCKRQVLSLSGSFMDSVTTELKREHCDFGDFNDIAREMENDENFHKQIMALYSLQKMKSNQKRYRFELDCFSVDVSSVGLIELCKKLSCRLVLLDGHLVVPITDYVKANGISLQDHVLTRSAMDFAKVFMKYSKLDISTEVISERWVTLKAFLITILYYYNEMKVKPPKYLVISAIIHFIRDGGKEIADIVLAKLKSNVNSLDDMQSSASKHVSISITDKQSVHVIDPSQKKAAINVQKDHSLKVKKVNKFTQTNKFTPEKVKVLKVVSAPGDCPRQKDFIGKFGKKRLSCCCQIAKKSHSHAQTDPPLVPIVILDKVKVSAQTEKFSDDESNSNSETRIDTTDESEVKCEPIDLEQSLEASLQDILGGLDVPPGTLGGSPNSLKAESTSSDCSTVEEASTSHSKCPDAAQTHANPLEDNPAALDVAFYPPADFDLYDDPLLYPGKRYASRKANAYLSGIDGDYDNLTVMAEPVAKRSRKTSESEWTGSEESELSDDDDDNYNSGAKAGKKNKLACLVCLAKMKKADLPTPYKSADRVCARHVVEDEPNTYKCDIGHCEKVFHSLASVIRHARVDHRKTLQMLPCKFCGKEFVCSLRLKYHESTHTGEKSHMCEFCGRAFIQITHLKSHIRQHTGEKPYQCEHCGLSYTHKISLRKHFCKTLGRRIEPLDFKNQHVGRPAKRVKDRSPTKQQRKSQSKKKLKAQERVQSSQKGASKATNK